MPLISGDVGTALFQPEVKHPLWTQEQQGTSEHHMIRLCLGVRGFCGSGYKWTDRDVSNWYGQCPLSAVQGG